MLTGGEPTHLGTHLGNRSTYLALAGLSYISLYICSKTLAMCVKSGTVSFWIGPKLT